MNLVAGFLYFITEVAPVAQGIHRVGVPNDTALLIAPRDGLQVLSVDSDRDINHFLKDTNATTHFFVQHLVDLSSTGGKSSEQHVGEECKQSCGVNVDSACVLKCQSEIYHCDEGNISLPTHTNKSREDDVAKCKADVIERYRNLTSRRKMTRFEAQAASAFGLHDSYNRRTVNSTLETNTSMHGTYLMASRVTSLCQDACGDNVDSDCAIACEVEMYACLDHNHTIPGTAALYNNCTSVLDMYKGYSANNDRSHFFMEPRLVHENVSVHISETAIANHEHAGADDKMHVQCEQSCGTHVDLSCVPECEAEIYHCERLSIISPSYANQSNDEEVEACKMRVLEKYKELNATWNATRLVVQSPVVRMVATSNQTINGLCQHACGPNAKSSCTVECEVEMYPCLDRNHTVSESAHVYDNCTENVLRKYKGLERPSSAAHFLSQRASIKTSDRKAARWLCGSACDSHPPFCFADCYKQMDDCFGSTEDRTTCERRVLRAFSDLPGVTLANHFLSRP